MYTETSLVSDGSARLHAPRVLRADLPEVETLSRSQQGVELNEPVAIERGTEHLAAAAGVAVRSTGTGPRSFVWRLVNGARTLSLEPMDPNGAPEGYGIVELRSPAPIHADFIQVSDYKNLAAVVDFFTTDGILYTAVVDYKQFSAAEFNTTQPWRVIKQPFAFDLVKPQVLHACSALHILVSLADGSLLSFTRKEPLGSLESRQLDDPHAPSGLGWMFRGDDRVEGKSTSKRCIVSIDSHNDFAITYSINNDIKLWSLAAHRCVFRLPCADSQAPLRLQKGPYVKFDDGATHVLAYTSLGRQPGFQVLQVVGETLESVAQTPEPGSEYANWLLTHVIFTATADAYQAVAAWRSNLSSVVKSVTVSRADLGVKSTVVSAREARTLLSLPEEADLEDFAASILSGVHYSSTTLRRALALYAPGVLGVDLEASVRTAVQQAAHNASDPSQQSMRLQWLRLDRICREVEAQSAELLALGYAGSAGGLMYIVRSGYVSVLTPTSRVADVLHNGPLAELFAALPAQAVATVQHVLALQIASPSDRLPFDAMEEIYDAVGPITLPQLDIERALSETLELFKHSPSRRAPHPLTPVGAELLARMAADYAKDAKSLLSRVLTLIVLAVAQGQLANGVVLFEAAAQAYKSALAILALEAPAGPSTTHKFSGRVSGLEIGVAAAQINVEGGSLASLPSLLFGMLDVSTSRGLNMFYDLAEERYAGIEAAAVFLPVTAAGVFVKGLGLLRADPATAKRLLLSVAPAIALRRQPDLHFLGPEFANPAGLSVVYLTVSRLAENAGAMDAALHFAKLAAQSPIAESQRQLQRLALIAGDLDSVYQVICCLHHLGDSGVRQAILQFFEAAAKQGRADEVVRGLPFVGMAQIVHDLLSSETSIGGIPSFKLLYVWSIAREDYVGAAAAIYAHLSATQVAAEGGPSEATAARSDWYTILLNALRCAAEPDRWMVVNRRVVTYETVEQEYLSLLSTMAKSLPTETTSAYGLTV